MVSSTNNIKKQERSQFHSTIWRPTKNLSSLIEGLDFKQLDAGMRFLLDTYIQAGATETVAEFEDQGMVYLIVKRGSEAIDSLPDGIKKDQEAVAETIVNNVRKVFIDERALNPKYYDTMSSLLDTLIEQRRKEALDYKRYLDELLKLAAKIGKKESDTVCLTWADNGAKKALVDFGFATADTDKDIDHVIMGTKLHDWVSSRKKERKVANALRHALPDGFERFDELFDLVRARDEYR